MPHVDRCSVRRVPCLSIAALALAAGLCSAAPDAPPAESTNASTPEAAARDFAQRVRDAAPVLAPLDADQPPLTVRTDTINFGRGPLTVYVPADYDPAVPTPVILLLHGYTNTGPEVEAYVRLAPLVDEYGFIYVHPTGTNDVIGNPFWNATDACCNLFGSSVNDSAYLRGIINTLQATYTVDARSIHIAGHSNGGFMAHRMSCEHADVVASIASLAGAAYNSVAACVPSEPVHVLQIHGTSDSVINYNGGCIPFGGCYPSAVGTAQRWAQINACGTAGVPTGETIDFDTSRPGAETTVTRWDSACADGGSAELWTIPSGAHSPPISLAGRRAMVEFLLSHPKPSPCSADFDANGVVNVLDVVAFITNWNAQGPGADANGDGLVNILDVVSFITEWNAGCP